MDFVKWPIKPSRMAGCITTSTISFRSTSEPKKMWVRIRHSCGGLVPTFTGFSDYPEKLPDEAIGCMTSAQNQRGLTFLRGKTLVATTHMLLLMYKLLLSPGRECLSTIVLSIAEGTSIWLPCSYRRQGRPLARK